MVWNICKVMMSDTPKSIRSKRQFTDIERKKKIKQTKNSHK